MTEEMEKIETVTAEEADAGERVDKALAAKLPGLTRSVVQRLLAEGRVTLSGHPVPKNYKLRAGDTLEVAIPAPVEDEALPEDIALDIRYEDDDLLVVNKPKGMVVHPAPGHPDGTVVNAVMYHCGGSLSGIGGELRPGIVHRIDKDTSGLLVVAKNDMAHAGLAVQLKDKSLSRIYEGIAVGRIRDDSGRIDAPIGRSLRDRKKMAVGGAAAREAATRYEVIARYTGYTHVRCSLETGRTHQIRVHMAYIGHPLAGDAVYGYGAGKTGLDGQCLHAGKIRFIHPKTGEAMTFECPLPHYFIDFRRKLERIEE